MRTLPLGLRIVALVVPLALLPMGLVGGVAYWNLDEAIRQDLEARQLRILESTAGALRGVRADPTRASLLLDDAERRHGGQFALCNAARQIVTASPAVAAARAADLLGHGLAIDAAAGGAHQVETGRTDLAVFVAPVEELPSGDARSNTEHFYLLRMVSPEPAFARLSDLRRSALMLAATACGFGLIGAGLLARTVVHPLSALLDGTRQIARGDFDVRLKMARRDEIGELVEGYNAMVASLSAYRAQLVQSERSAALGRLASTVAHEVRNPLNAMRGCVDYMRLKRPDDPVVTHHAGIIADEIERLDSFVGNFLRLARLQPPQLVPVDIADLLTSRLDLHEASAASRRVTITRSLPPGLPTVTADPKQLGIVFENLVNNAVDAMPSGGTLAVAVTARDGWLAIWFGDTGTGMTEAVVRQVFSPFFTTKPDGTGLGLATCRRIAELHGGMLEFSSQVGDGTTFVLKLPLARHQDPSAV